MKTEYFHTNDVYSCIGYATSGAQLDTSPAQLDTSPLSSATINNSEQLHNELGETQLTQLSYRWHFGSVTGDLDATSMIVMHSFICMFVHQYSYKQLECKFLHGSVTRYTTTVVDSCRCPDFFDPEPVRAACTLCDCNMGWVACDSFS